MLGRFLSRGLAGERDLAQAKIWLERAQTLGMAEAADDLERLRSERTGAAA
jgi:TPR repeat protein